jgi:hypothetical protein
MARYARQLKMLRVFIHRPRPKGRFRHEIQAIGIGKQPPKVNGLFDFALRLQIKIIDGLYRFMVICRILLW